MIYGREAEDGNAAGSTQVMVGGRMATYLPGSVVGDTAAGEYAWSQLVMGIDDGVRLELRGMTLSLEDLVRVAANVVPV